METVFATLDSVRRVTLPNFLLQNLKECFHMAAESEGIPDADEKVSAFFIIVCSIKKLHFSSEVITYNETV